jgi:hypothetical protein
MKAVLTEHSARSHWKQENNLIECEEQDKPKLIAPAF